METISVIVPFYNGNKHLHNLKRVIENNVLVAKQEENISVELVLVNDSPWIVIQTEKIESELYKLSLVCLNENGGIHNARVRGLEIATGKYVVFLDQDDLWSDMFLREMYKCCKGDKVECVIANGVFETPTGKKRILNSYGRVLFAKKYYSYLFLGNLLSSPGQCLIRKNSIPVYWKENIMKTNCSDDLFLWCLMFKEIKVAFCNQLLYTHVDTGENFSLDKQKGYESDLELLGYLKNYKKIASWITKVFEMRCSYNIQKLNNKIDKPLTYTCYFLINNLLKLGMRVMGLVCIVFGKRISRL